MVSRFVAGPNGRSISKNPMIKNLNIKNAIDRSLKNVVVRSGPSTQLETLGGGDHVVLQGTGASNQGLKNVRQRTNYFARLTFLLVVLMPTVCAAIYYGLFASDQYIVETRFSVRSGEGRNVDALSSLGVLSGLPTAAASNDSYVVIDFLKSPSFVRSADQDLGLIKIYHDGADFFSRISGDARLENLVEYWREMVRPRVDTPSQSVVISVRAFSAENALLISRYVISKSEKLVNELSEKSRNEALAFAREEVQIAEKRLRADREAVKNYRDNSRVLDPGRSVASRQELAGRLQAEIVSLSAEMRSLESYLTSNAPAIITLRNRIASLQVELTRVQGDFSDGNNKLSSVIRKFEDLQTDTTFAEKAYISALASLDRARAEADRNIKYLAVHVQPTAPEVATQPRRTLNILAVLVVSFMLWGTGWLIFLGIRDHMH